VPHVAAAVAAAAEVFSLAHAASQKELCGVWDDWRRRRLPELRLFGVLSC
jgi:hypothetical protein